MNHPQDPPAACHTFRLAADAALTDPAPDPGWSSAPHAQECAACAVWLRAFATYRRRLRALGDAILAPDSLRARVTARFRSDPPTHGP